MSSQFSLVKSKERAMFTIFFLINIICLPPRIYTLQSAFHAQKLLFRTHHPHHSRFTNDNIYCKRACSLIQLSSHDITIREWKDGDETRIYNLLSEESQCNRDFDPEGPLEVDCGSKNTIKECYSYPDGFFLVATEPLLPGIKQYSEEFKLLGTVAVIIGTKIAYMNSGESLTSPQKVTCAIRRLCIASDCTREASRRKSIIRSLLLSAEEIAVKENSNEIITLAYSSLDLQRADDKFLTEMGYQSSPASAAIRYSSDGSEAIQYFKNIELLSDNASIGNGEISFDEDESNNDPVKNITSNVDASGFVIGALFATIILVATLGIANIMGLEAFQTSDNRGIGLPLSIQELQRLEQDEKLQRTDIQKNGMEENNFLKIGKQQNKLDLEDLREEDALMNIIEGRNIRLK